MMAMLWHLGEFQTRFSCSPLSKHHYGHSQLSCWCHVAWAYLRFNNLNVQMVEKVISINLLFSFFVNTIHLHIALDWLLPALNTYIIFMCKNINIIMNKNIITKLHHYSIPSWKFAALIYAYCQSSQNILTSMKNLLIQKFKLQCTWTFLFLMRIRHQFLQHRQQQMEIF